MKISAILRIEWQPYLGNVFMDALPTKEECAKVAKAVEKIAIRLFPELRVVRVSVEARRDHEGDPVLWTYVVVDSPGEVPPNTEGLLNFRSHLRPYLEELGISADPVMTYQSYKEVGDAA